MKSAYFILTLGALAACPLQTYTAHEIEFRVAEPPVRTTVTDLSRITAQHAIASLGTNAPAVELVRDTAGNTSLSSINPGKAVSSATLAANIAKQLHITDFSEISALKTAIDTSNKSGGNLDAINVALKKINVWHGKTITEKQFVQAISDATKSSSLTDLSNHLKSSVGSLFKPGSSRTTADLSNVSSIKLSEDATSQILNKQSEADARQTAHSDTLTAYRASCNRFEAAQANVTRTGTLLASARYNVGKLSAEKSSLETQQDDLASNQIPKLNATLRSKQAELKGQWVKSDSLSQEITRLIQNIDSLTQLSTSITRKLKNLQPKLETAQADQAKAQEVFDAAQSELTKAVNDRDSKQAALDSAASSVQQANAAAAEYSAPNSGFQQYEPGPSPLQTSVESIGSNIGDFAGQTGRSLQFAANKLAQDTQATAQAAGRSIQTATSTVIGKTRALGSASVDSLARLADAIKGKLGLRELTYEEKQAKIAAFKKAILSDASKLVSALKAGRIKETDPQFVDIKKYITLYKNVNPSDTDLDFQLQYLAL